MYDPASLPDSPEPAPPLLGLPLSGLHGGHLYRDLSELPACVSVSVSVEIYADDQTEAFVRPARPASAQHVPAAALT
ncbi:hypothetical protein GCM10022631_20480 [Deinococcus rubellus]|uniref:Uncharacterized protein n=1 Tax=Deinococcus rubellus TaxID=1889240 RepID=A0ABY5YJR0_9DEIO|nr:hypothetical protein [Deinococcus rubellus]UWX64371.1 hypothetical protein N0D28_01485 [Deinococcus rubellus]